MTGGAAAAVAFLGGGIRRLRKLVLTGATGSAPAAAVAAEAEEGGIRPSLKDGTALAPGMCGAADAAVRVDVDDDDDDDDDGGFNAECNNL